MMKLIFFFISCVLALDSYKFNAETIHIAIDINFNSWEVDPSFSSETSTTCRGSFGPPKRPGNWNVFKARSIHYGVEDNNIDRMYYCFGFAEGILTFREINHFFGNMFSDWFTDFKGSPNPKPLYNFLVKNYDYMVNKSMELKYNDPYWANISLLLSQLKGLYDGYIHAMKKQKRLFAIPLEFEDFLFINADGDLETLIYAMKEDAFHNIEDMRKDYNRLSFFSQRESRCSALIKLIDSNGVKDVLVGHTTWDHFQNMGPRILKSYYFENHPRHSFTMSSSPGMLSSVDDFFITGEGLIVTETTNEVYNSSLFALITPKKVLTWARARVANLESTCQSWADTFSRENSGTYNNQWMIIDSKRLLSDISSKKKQNIHYDSFIVLEQLPSHIVYESQVDHLVKHGYWASYNIPFYQKIWEQSNYSQQSPLDEFSYEHNPRANIFRREIKTGAINSVTSFRELMRFNNFKYDPLSKGNACFSISSRCDLNNVTSSIYKASGGIDCKIASVRNVNKGFENTEFIAQLGPTNTRLPAFSWKNLYKRLHKYNISSPTHLGQSNVYSFPWIKMKVV